MTLTLDFEGEILKISSIMGTRGWIDMETKGCESIGCWIQFVSLNFDITHDFDFRFSRSNFNSHIVEMGRSIDLEYIKKISVGYNVGHTMCLLLGHSTWQIHWPSNGSVWNGYSFQPVGPWMGCPFTDIGAEGYCHSLNALLRYGGAHLQ